MPRCPPVAPQWVVRHLYRLCFACGISAAYFSMYAFRKPFTAASFDGVDGWHYALDFKIALVLAQLIGYAASKFIGIKVISGIAAGPIASRRSWA